MPKRMRWPDRTLSTSHTHASRTSSNKKEQVEPRARANIANSVQDRANRMVILPMLGSHRWSAGAAEFPWLPWCYSRWPRNPPATRHPPGLVARTPSQDVISGSKQMIPNHLSRHENRTSARPLTRATSRDWTVGSVWNETLFGWEKLFLCSSIFDWSRESRALEYENKSRQHAIALRWFPYCAYSENYLLYGNHLPTSTYQKSAC